MPKSSSRKSNSSTRRRAQAATAARVARISKELNSDVRGLQELFTQEIGANFSPRVRTLLPEPALS